MAESVVVDLSDMFDNSESTCVSTTSLIQSLNRYFAQLNISKYQATMGRSVGLRVKFSAEINCKWRKVVDAFPTLQIFFLCMRHTGGGPRISQRGQRNERGC